MKAMKKASATRLDASFGKLKALVESDGSRAD
jgi:hypothetical protein